jgi:sugar phosphate isomerase/epimerase
MIKLGVNSVLFHGHDLPTAMKHIAMAGYDGIELSAIAGSDHLFLDKWREQKGEVQSLAKEHHLELLSMEVASLDEARLTKAYEAGAEIGIPIINIGPGGKADEPGDLERQTDLVAKLADKAATYGVTLCMKAHVGASVYNTPTTLYAMKTITSPAFGIDMDPSHIYRANENPAEALPAVLSRVKHVHIRDCKGRGPGPGDARDQACGRGDVDLMGYCRAMVQGGYNGPACLEVIGAGGYTLEQKVTIAAETYGYLNACLKSLGGR